MTYPEEPHRLIGNVLVHAGAISLLESLLASGHSVSFDDDVGLTVEPFDLHEDVLFLLDSFEEDLAILFRAGSPTIH